jgi:uridine kinase
MASALDHSANEPDDRDPPSPVRGIIGIAGGTGSGKTTVASVILDRVGPDHVAYLPHDAYYRNEDDLPRAQPDIINWDHPIALETALMTAHVRALRAGQPVELPTYDFTTNRRTGRTVHVAPRPIVIVEGILIFAEPELRRLFDMKIFVDTDSDLRFIRRLQRDLAERGRATDSVIQQYLTTVRPMHLEFVEPSKRYADIIVPEGGRNEVALGMIVARLESLLSGR